MRVVVIGKGLMLANIILGLKDAGADIVGVLRYEQTCTPGFKLFWRDFFMPAPEVTLIHNLKLKQIRMKSANSDEFKDLLVKLNVDLVIVGTWKEKLKPEIFNTPTIATVNVHPSLLPKYRGPNPYMQAILHKEEFSGVTIHLMTADYDKGPILVQKKIRISDSDTSQDLRAKSVCVARDLVTQLINDLNGRALMPVNQDERYASYYPHISGNERMLDFSIQSSEDISATIRALHPFLPTYITYKNKHLVVDPYHFKITDLVPSNAKPGDVVEKYSEYASLSMVCADNRIIKFSNLKLYKSKGIKKFIDKDVDLIHL